MSCRSSDRRKITTESKLTQLLFRCSLCRRMKKKKEPSITKTTTEQLGDSLERIIFCRCGRTVHGDDNSLMPSAVIEGVELGRKIATLCRAEELVVLTSPIACAFKTTEAIVTPEFFSAVEVRQLDVLKTCNDAGQKEALAFVDAVTTLQKSRERTIKILVCVTHESFFGSGSMEIICRALFGQEIYLTERSASFAPSAGGFRVLQRNGSYHSTL